MPCWSGSVKVRMTRTGSGDSLEGYVQVFELFRGFLADEFLEGIAGLQ